MSNLRKHSLLILMGMLILLILPISFAADADSNQTVDVIGSEESTDSMSIDEVDASNVESSSDDDVLSANYDYETTVTPSSVNYTKGETSYVTVKTSHPADDPYNGIYYQSTLQGYDFYAYIGGENSNPVKVNLPLGFTYKQFSFDLAQISDYLQEGENTVYFHHSLDENIFVGGWLSSTHFNPLTVNVTSIPTYVSTPSPANVYFYEVGNSRIVNVTITYSDLFEERLPEEASMFVYINGEEIANRVKIEGVPGNATSFSFDLATVSDKLVNGKNNLTFHPHPGTLEGIQNGPYVFNKLMVDVITVEPKLLYVTTPSVSEIDYIKGESTVVNVTADYVSDEDDPFSGLDLVGSYIYCYVDNDTNGIVVNKPSDAKFFSVDLNNLNYDFEEGRTYSLVFHPPASILNNANVSLSDCKFNPLTVNVQSKPPVVYEVNITDPANAVVNYVKGNASVRISVKTSYNYTTMSALDGSKMYAYVNGNLVGIVNSTLDTEVRGSASTFSFYLTQFDEYLTEKVNTIIFHPDESYYAEANIDEHRYHPLTVVIVGEETSSELKYVSTPTVNGSSTVEYFINEHKDVLVTVNCTLLDQFESYDKLFAWVGESSYDINMMANEGTVTVDLYSIINANFFEEGQTYIIYFHPNIDVLNDIGINESEYEFNPLIVSIAGTHTPEPVLVYTSTPEVDGNSSIEYTIGKNTIVNVTVDYADVRVPSGFSGKSMKIFINSADGVVIPDVNANATSFTVNLADYIDSEGKYNLSFHPDASTLSWVFYGIDNQVYEFNNLTVNAVNATEEKLDVNWTVNAIADNEGNVQINVEFDRIVNGTVTFYINNQKVDSKAIENDVHVSWNATNLEGGNYSYKVVFTSDKFNTLEGFGNFAVDSGNVCFYTTTPSPSAVEYTLGDSTTVEVKVDYNATYADEFGRYPIYVVINNGESIEIAGIRGNDTNFQFDLKSVSDYLTVGRNTISFQIRDVEIPEADLSATFNDLIVNAKNAPTDPNATYVSIPTPSNVNYTLNESLVITVTIVYSDLFEERMPEEASMFVYINGEEMADRVKIEGVAGNATSFTFDLKTVSDRLVNGTNNLTFHPHPGALEGIQVGPYIFNVLTVNVGNVPEPIEPVIDNETVSTPTIKIASVNVGNGAIINVTLPSNATGRVIVFVGDKNQTANLTDGFASLSFDDLPAGENIIVVYYSGDDNFTNAFATGSLTANKADSIINATDIEINVGEPALITVNAPKDATGIVLVDIGDKRFYGEIDDGKASVIATGLEAGSYVADVKYLGDGKYENASTSININVNAKSEPAPETNITVVVDGISYPAELVNGTAVVNTSKIEPSAPTTVVVDGVSYPVEFVNGTAIVNTNKTEPAKPIATVIESEYKFTRQANDYNVGERGAFFYAVLKDINGNPLANMPCYVAVNGPIYNVTTDNQGRFGVQVNLAAANTYTYALSFLGNDQYGASFNCSKLILTAKKTSITASAKTFKAKAKTKTISVTLKTVKNPYNGKTYLKAGKKLTLKINGKTYTAKTNAKGVAKFTIKLTKKGKYAATVKFAGDKTYNASSKKIKVTIK